MNLVLDIGNTRSKYGVFDKHVLVHKGVAQKVDLSFLRKILKKFAVDSIIFSSVAGVNRNVLAYAEKQCSVIFLTYTTPLPFLNHYKTPQTLGTDRLANAAGAAQLFPRKNGLVIDAGTCIKFDIITAEGHYLGGAISPGVAMRFKALHHFTERLPLVKPQPQPALIGNTTVNSINSGVVNGAKAEVKQLIAEYRSQYKRLKIVVTGGDAAFFDHIAKKHIFAAPDLTLTGLNHILNYNKTISRR